MFYKVPHEGTIATLRHGKILYGRGCKKMVAKIITNGKAFYTLRSL